MKRFLLLAAFLMSGVVFTAFAQPCPGCTGPHGADWKMRMEGGPMPMRQDMMERRMMHMMGDEGTRTSVRGKVVSIEPAPMGAKLMVESESRLVPVILGPGWGRPDDGERKVEPNDMVEIIGHRVMRDGQPVVIAGEIRMDEDNGVVVLRPDRPGPIEKMERIKVKRHVAY